jgi:hypothetical protein
VQRVLKQALAESRAQHKLTVSPNMNLSSQSSVAALNGLKLRLTWALPRSLFQGPGSDVDAASRNALLSAISKDLIESGLISADSLPDVVTLSSPSSPECTYKLSLPASLLFEAAVAAPDGISSNDVKAISALLNAVASRLASVSGSSAHDLPTIAPRFESITALRRATDAKISGAASGAASPTVDFSAMSPDEVVASLREFGITVHTRDDNIKDHVDWDTIAGYDDVKRVRV